MHKLHALAAALVLQLAGVHVATANQHPLNEENFSTTLTLTTDYVWRGTSLSGEDPALQGSFDWSYGNLFAGVWGSNIDSVGSLELDYYIGYANSLAGFDWYVQPLYYHYPGDADSNTFELWLGASRTLDFGGAIEPTASLLYAWTPDYFNTDGTGNYIYGNLALALPVGISLDGGVAYQDVGGIPDDRAFSYVHWDVGLSTSLAGFDLDLRYHGNSDDSPGDDYQNFWGAGFERLTDARAVFTISRSF